MANVAAAIEAIDLLTYNGEDPCLIHEPACQYCHAKQSDKTLTRCSKCSFVWYCSEDCVEADSEQHESTCWRIALNKIGKNACVQILCQQYQITNPFVPNKIIPVDARPAHEHLESVMASLAQFSYDLATQGETKELWEKTLYFHRKLFRMLEPRSPSSLRCASEIAFTFIRLGRLQDAWRFIRNTMVKFKSNGRSPIVIGYEPQDRYTDCLKWVRSSYPLTTESKDVQENFHRLILGLIIIKLRIRFDAARNAWKDTINKVFLKTDQRQLLGPGKSVLEECFILSDDTFQLEQIRQLIGIVHYFDPSMIPKLLNGEIPVDDPLRNAFMCLHRTPSGPELLSTILQSEGFTDWVIINEPLVLTHNAAYVANERMSMVKFCAMMMIHGYTAQDKFLNSEGEDSNVSGYALALFPFSPAICGFLIAVAAIVFPSNMSPRNVGSIYLGTMMVVLSMMVLSAHDLIEFMDVGTMCDLMLPLGIANLFLWLLVVPSKAILVAEKEEIKKEARI